MTAKLIYLKSHKRKCNMQVWRFNPSKALRLRKDIVHEIGITDEEADTMSLKELEKKYGSIVFASEQ